MCVRHERSRPAARLRASRGGASLPDALKDGDRTGTGGRTRRLHAALVTLGVFGVVSRAITERTREVGVRVALGAAPHDVALLIVRQHLASVAVGLALGSVLAAGLSHAARTLLFGIGAHHLATYAAANLLLFAIAGGVACAAARRVLRIDPAVAVRDRPDAVTPSRARP